MQLHELARQVDGFRLRLDLDERIAADDFLRLDERSVRDLHRAAIGPHAKPLRGVLEAGGVLEHARREPFRDELTHGVEQSLRDWLGAIVLRVSDEHEPFHDRSPLVRVKDISLTPREALTCGRPEAAGIDIASLLRLGFVALIVTGTIVEG